jgi:hypothetical protein
MLNNVVNNQGQYGQQNIVQACFQQHCYMLHGKKRRARYSTGLNNVWLPTLFTLVNNIEQCC